MIPMIRKTFPLLDAAIKDGGILNVSFEKHSEELQFRADIVLAGGKRGMVSFGKDLEDVLSRLNDYVSNKL